MQTTARLIHGDAAGMDEVADESVDLVVTSPPYPMIEMWDGLFRQRAVGVEEALAAASGDRAFAAMHDNLDAAWREVHRVLRPGGIACINIGDATRTLAGEFRLYPNHSRVLAGLSQLGLVTLPDILWRKPTNAPTKFMGSGMLPPGAYVTYEHEYILIARKGKRREFVQPREKALRRQSAFFWEERNSWFSDVWFDLRGAGQKLVDPASRQRSAAFPFELAYRLVCMYSIKGDTVLDPFSGTGMTAAAALAAGRNSIAVEIDQGLLAAAENMLHSLAGFANAYTRERLLRHVEFTRKRAEEGGRMKHVNRNYLFPVVTAQERDLIFNDIISISRANGSICARYDEKPQRDLAEQRLPPEADGGSSRDSGGWQLRLPHQDLQDVDPDPGRAPQVRGRGNRSSVTRNREGLNPMRE